MIFPDFWKVFLVCQDFFFFFFFSRRKGREGEGEGRGREREAGIHGLWIFGLCDVRVDEDSEVMKDSLSFFFFFFPPRALCRSYLL